MGPEGLRTRWSTPSELAGIHADDARKHVQRVTAANASGINDGAAAILLASGEAVQNAYGLKPMAKLVGWGAGRRRSQDHGRGSVPASRTPWPRPA